MGKLTYEQAKEAAEAATAKRKEARAALESFAKANGVNPKKVKDAFDDKKFGKELKGLNATWKKAKEAEDAAAEVAKGLKPASERNSKYEYPADVVTEQDKKKFRAKQRAAAKAKDKPAKPAKEEKTSKEEKPSKKDKKAKDEPAAEVPAKKDKKKKKDKVEEED